MTRHSFISPGVFGPEAIAGMSASRAQETRLAGMSADEPDVFRRRQERQARQERYRLIAIRVLDVLIALALAAMTALVLTMILY